MSAENAKSFVAIITPISGCATPPPLGIWGGAGEPWPTPPIVIVPPEKPGDPPVFIWGGGNEPFPTPPIVIVPPERPEEPPLVIWGPPDMPPGFWGGGMGPGVKPQPRPEHPIVRPPAGDRPVHIWGGGAEGFPTNPIVIPKPPDPFPEAPPEVVKPAPDEGGWGYANPPGVWYFVPGTGSAQPK